MKLQLDKAYTLSVDFIVIPKQGSGTVLTLNDIANALERIGATVHVAKDIQGNKISLIVAPARHLVTGEDFKMQAGENDENA